METESLHEIGAAGKLRVFSLYADMAASRRARLAANAIGRRAGPPWQFSAEMWKLETLNYFESVRRIIAGDATRADTLILAISALNQQPQEMIRWLESLAGFKSPQASHPLLMLGLLGDEEGRARELDWTVKQLLRCAQKLDRDFIWRWMEPEALNDLDWLNEAVERLLSRKACSREPLSSREMVVGVG